MINLSAVETTRTISIYLHLLAVIVACTGIAFGDFSIFGGKQINQDLLRKSTHAVACALGALWITGMVIIGLDSGLNLAALLEKPKLMAKITVVLLLTLNGALLHAWFFPQLLNAGRVNVAINLAVILGAFSAVGWLFAVFLGIAKPLTPILGYVGFMVLYGLGLLLALLLAFVTIKPKLLNQITEHNMNIAEIYRKNLVLEFSAIRIRLVAH